MAPVPTDPVHAWHAHAAQVQALLEDRGSASRVLRNPHTGELPLGTAIDCSCATDVLLHTWDLARASGQDDTLDPKTCAALLAGMTPIDQVLRTSGHYGPRVAVPADADAQTQLIGFLGRDPSWTRGPG